MLMSDAPRVGLLVDHEEGQVSFLKTEVVLCILTLWRREKGGNSLQKCDYTDEKMKN